MANKFAISGLRAALRLVFLARKGARFSQAPVLMGVVCAPLAAAAVGATAQIPAVARVLATGRYAAVGAMTGLGLSIVALVFGALALRGPAVANAVKFCSLALLIVSLGVLIGACQYIPKVTTVAPSMTVTVTPASNSITTAQSLVVNVTVVYNPGTNGTPLTGSPTGTVVLTSGTAPNVYTSATENLTSSGTYAFTIPAGSLPAGTDTHSRLLKRDRFIHSCGSSHRNDALITAGAQDFSVAASTIFAAVSTVLMSPSIRIRFSFGSSIRDCVMLREFATTL